MLKDNILSLSTIYKAKLFNIKILSYRIYVIQGVYKMLYNKLYTLSNNMYMLFDNV